MLDYLWASLPILATKGDSFAELISQYELGKVVPYQDEEALAQAILALLDHPEKIQLIKQNIAKIRERFYWLSVTEPLKQMISRLSEFSDEHQGHPFLTYSQFIMTKIKEKGA